MFTYLFIWSLLCFSTNGNDAKDSFFDGNFKLAYQIISTNEMEIRVLMPIKFKWLLAGFHNIPYLSSPQEDLFWLGIKKENNKVKPILQSCQLQVNNKLKCNKRSSLYRFEIKTKYHDEWYYFIIKRSPEGLQYGSEITFLWAFGTQESIETPRFVTKLHTLDVILELKNLFQLENNREQISTLQPLLKEDDMAIAPNDEAITTSLLNKSIYFNTSIHYKPQNSGENISLEWKETDNPITILLNDNEMDNFAEKSITPSFTFAKCNCSSCNCSSSFYWFSILHSKENSVYIAILGASALLTGLIVLFIVCTCSIKSPKQSKKTVDFYKIDELESDDDEEGEEVYFIKN